MTAALGRIREALHHVPACERETWLRMGMAVKSELGDEGFEVWDAWSQQADSYGERDARDVWRSLSADGKVTVGTLYHEAKAHGWRGGNGTSRPTADEVAERSRIAAERRAADEAQIARDREATAARAQALWGAAGAARPDHPYFVRKQLAPVPNLGEIDAGAAARVLGYVPRCGGEALTGRLIVVPVLRGDDAFATLELIDIDGRKAALAGRGTKAGGYWPAQEMPEGDGAGVTMLIGEGVATVLSARQATGNPVVAALSAGNLPAVAKAMRDRYPAAELVILVDLVKATGEPDRHAIEAARAVGGLLAVPDFGAERSEGATDFNDLALLHGIEGVQRAIEAATAPGADKHRVDAGESAAGDSSGQRGANCDAADLDTEVARLARLPALEYERQRKEAAKRLQVRADVLDRVVSKSRGSEKAGQGSAVLFDEIEPAAEAAPLAELLAGLTALLSACVILPAHAACAVALWIVATWATDHTSCAPLLLVKSPEPRCGKTTLLELLAAFVRRALSAASITPAAMFRTIEAASPTLLIDEGDAFLRGNEELRGVINAGHTRATAFVLRTVGDDHEPRRFSVFGFKTIALIGKAAHTITDRSIVIPLRRKLPSERVTKLRDTPKAEWATLQAGLARWARDDAHRIASARPTIPEALNDRAGDSWQPLLAVADLAGGEWPERARAAALALSGHAEEATGTGAELLADVRRVFDERGVDRIAGADLLSALLADEERPWATFNAGRPLSQSQLARRLSAFGISSRSIRQADGRTPKGYPRDAFADAFARYLPSTPYQSATPPQASTGAGCGGLPNRHTDELWHFEKPPQASAGAGCGGVAVSNPRTGDRDAAEVL